MGVWTEDAAGMVLPVGSSEGLGPLAAKIKPPLDQVCGCVGVEMGVWLCCRGVDLVGVSYRR